MYEELLDIDSIYGMTIGKDILRVLTMSLIKRTYDGKTLNLLQLMEAKYVR